MSTTIGVAFATLLVVGGILAGPSIIDCSKDGSHFGACLRDKASQSGLIAPEGETIDKPALISEAAPDKPPIVSDIAPPQQGWIEARANEYPGPPAASAVLSPPDTLVRVDGLVMTHDGGSGDAALVAPSGRMSAMGSVAPTGAPAIHVALVRSAADLAASGASVNGPDTASASLVPRAGALGASGRMTRDQLGAARVALTRPEGSLDASGSSALPLLPADLTMISAPGQIVASGTAAVPQLPADLTLGQGPGGLRAGGGEGVGTTLEASIAPVSTSSGDMLTTGGIGGTFSEGTVVLKAPPPPKITKPARKASLPTPAPIRVPKAPKSPAIKFNPKFPNVVVLPPPATGADSSFATLQLN